MRARPGGDRVFTSTRMLTPLIYGPGHTRNVVLDRASLSISNAFVLAKSPFSFSIACCAGAVGSYRSDAAWLPAVRE